MLLLRRDVDVCWGEGEDAGEDCSAFEEAMMAGAEIRLSILTEGLLDSAATGKTTLGRWLVDGFSARSSWMSHRY